MQKRLQQGWTLGRTLSQHKAQRRSGIYFWVTSVKQKINKEMRSMLGNSFTTRFGQSPWITGAGRRSKGFWHRETVKELIGPYCHCQEKAQPGSLQTNRKSLLTIIRRHEKTQYNAEWQNTDGCSKFKFDLSRECKVYSSCKTHKFFTSF